MSLTSAEKMRWYRQCIREDAARHEIYKQRERDSLDRWTERKNLGKTPTIESKSERGKRVTRSQWRKAQKESIIKKLNLQAIVTPRVPPITNLSVKHENLRPAASPPQLAGPPQPTQWTEEEGKEQVKTLPAKGVVKDSSSPTASFNR